jgi:hypothetical protein
MGTNYYLHQKPDCECCGRAFEPLHIGKSAPGWCFFLHVTPEGRINNLDDWRALWAAPGAYVRNEYGERVELEDLEKIITQRQWKGEFPKRQYIDGRHCVGHGEGTWDYVAGEFA